MIQQEKKIKSCICCLGENDAFQKEGRHGVKLILDIKIHGKRNVSEIWKNIQKNRFEEKDVTTSVHIMQNDIVDRATLKKKFLY